MFLGKFSYFLFFLYKKDLLPIGNRPFLNARSINLLMNYFFSASPRLF